MPEGGAILTTPRTGLHLDARSATATHKPWSALRSALHADDAVSEAVASFAAGKIDFKQLNRVLDEAEGHPREA
jgi:hypothetical protein